MTHRPISEDDLNAFVDGRLDATRRLEVVSYLDAHPDTASRIEGYSEQRKMLRTLLGTIAEEPVPAELDISRMIGAKQKGPPLNRWTRAAAASFLLCFGAAAGWIAGTSQQTEVASSMDLLAREAAASYVAYAPDLVRPVEIAASDSKTLAAWTTKRVGRPIAIPDLSQTCCEFLGGRVVPTEYGPAAVLMYEDAQRTRFVILARPIEARSDLPMAAVGTRDLNGFAWVDEGIGYSLVGPLSSDAMHNIANNARNQTRNRI